MKREEALHYTETFLLAREEDISRASQIVNDLNVDRITEESYFSMMMDTE